LLGIYLSQFKYHRGVDLFIINLKMFCLGLKYLFSSVNFTDELIFQLEMHPHHKSLYITTFVLSYFYLIQ